MGNKYVVELEDQMYVPNGNNTVSSDKMLYKVKGFNSLVFDEIGLSRLDNLDKYLKQSYSEGYKRGRQSGEVESSEKSNQSDYERGLSDAWEIVRRLILPKDCGCNNSLITVIRELFGNNVPGWQIRRIFMDYSIYDVKKRVDDYDSKISKVNESDTVIDEINVGDEIKLGDNKKGIVFAVDEDAVRGYLFPIQALQPIPFSIKNKPRLTTESSVKTGRSFPELLDILKQMEEK